MNLLCENMQSRQPGTEQMLLMNLLLGGSVITVISACTVDVYTVRKSDNWADAWGVLDSWWVESRKIRKIFLLRT
eukprot:COSAG02_NODE_47562_length_340_cov_0.838174_2_plen_74_part_01